MSKSVIYIGASIGGIVGGLIGSRLDNGNLLGLWGLLFSTLGGIAGVYIAYKVQQ